MRISNRKWLIKQKAYINSINMSGYYLIISCALKHGYISSRIVGNYAIVPILLEPPAISFTTSVALPSATESQVDVRNVKCAITNNFEESNILQKNQYSLG